MVCALSLSPVLLAETSQRYRVELGGEPIGLASLSVTCREQPATCRVTWTSRLRLPDTAPGDPEVLERRIEIGTDRIGRARQVRVQDGRTASTSAVHGERFPAALVELILSETPDGERRCIDVIAEETGEEGRACARRQGEWLFEDLLGVAVRSRSPRAGLPLEVVIPEHRIQFLADPQARLPGKPPRLYGVEVPRAPEARIEGPLRFCGAAAEKTGDPVSAPAIPPSLPGDCRAQTTRYLALAAAAGVQGRHAVGVAWDGRAFVWHEWAELLLAGRWSAVDPAFRQVPAQGPRFTLGRFADGEEKARLEAGKKILSCWGRSLVSAAR